MDIGIGINLNHKRPDKELIEAFRGIPVANVDDCMSRMSALESEIRPVNKVPLLGLAFTVKVPAGDNLMFHKAMDLALPGDVIVIDAKGGMERAIFGELMTKYCEIRGIAGIIVDGCIRDRDALSKMNIPVYARGTSPNGPYKNGPGEIGSVISLGGQIVRPGDIVLGDQDGVVIIKPEDAPRLLKAAEEIQLKEENIMKNILEKGTYERPWVDEILQKIGCILP